MSDLNDFAKAIQLVRKEMQNDEGLWISYQANIAMSLFDNKAGDHAICTKLADELMNRIFDAPRKEDK